MAKHDWYRNKTWNDQIATAFYEKLARTKKHTKPQYLRIQALELANNPTVSLELLDQYFALNDEFDTAQAWLQRAQIYAKLGRTNDAIEAALQSVACEKKRPTALTNVTLWLPLFIAERKRANLYDTALDLLQSRTADIFPSQYFDRFAAKALISEDRGAHTEAAEYAATALEFASRKRGFLSKHQSLGLVGAERSQLVRKMKVIAKPRSSLWNVLRGK